jgi:hypothetical protein
LSINPLKIVRLFLDFPILMRVKKEGYGRWRLLDVLCAIACLIKVSGGISLALPMGLGLHHSL